MKIVLLADLHGNMTATEAMERELDQIKPDDIWFLGDAVGKGPESDKTCDWVRNHCRHWIAGNWDRGLSSERNEDNFFTRQIGPERFDWLDSLPLEDELTISGIRFRLVHGRFLDPLYLSFDPDEKLREGFRYLLIIFQCGLYSLLRKYGAVHLIIGKTVKRLCYGFVCKLHSLRYGLAFYHLGSHGAGCYGTAAAEGLELYILYDIILYLHVHLHDIAAFSVSYFTYRIRILYHTYVSGIAEMIHYFFTV